MISNELIARPVLTAASIADLPLGLEIETCRGLCWRHDQLVADLWPEQERWLAALARRVASPAEDAEPPHAEILALRQALPDRAVLVATECIAADDNAPLVLVDALHCHKGVPIATQLVARSLTEEGAVLAALDNILADKDCLVTFAGKNGDWSRLEARRKSHRLRGVAWKRSQIHCDLAAHARRRWKNRLPDCKLTTLEQYICGRQRPASGTNDDFATVYAESLEQPSSDRLQLALQHHVLDLITVWQLARWLAHA